MTLLRTYIPADHPARLQCATVIKELFAMVCDPEGERGHALIVSEGPTDGTRRFSAPLCSQAEREPLKCQICSSDECRLYVPVSVQSAGLHAWIKVAPCVRCGVGRAPA